jgi:hypothetical protein
MVALSPRQFYISVILVVALFAYLWLLKHSSLPPDTEILIAVVTILAITLAMFLVGWTWHVCHRKQP